MAVHKSVLLHEAIEGLNLPGRAETPVVIDGTFGAGGHSREICAKNPGAKIIALDQDAGAIKAGKKSFKNEGLDCEISFYNVNFRNLEEAVVKEGLIKEAGVDGVILDLGISSDQLEASGRGFSFMKDEPLIMTMKENPLPEDLTAKDVVNTWSEENLADIIYGYGEERFSRRIARGIVEARKKKKLGTTFDLVKAIGDAVPMGYKKARINPATKTFQAIRIAVNDELGALTEGLKQGLKALRPGGRMSVITFHSLEDRIVKRWSHAEMKEGKLKLVNKKPIAPRPEEVKENPRARSAKLRIIEKL